MSTSIIPFTQGEWNIRVVQVDGEPYFLLLDVRNALDLDNNNAVVARIRKDDGVVIHHPIQDSLGRTQQAVWISEAGLYKLAFQSKVPAAEAFTDWITGTVLPSIRKTGGYGQQLQLTDDELVDRALQITAAKVKALEAKVVEDAPKVAYVDEFVADGDLRTIRSVASSLHVGEGVLRQALLKHKWIYAQQRSRWSQTRQEKVIVTRYSAYADHREHFEAVPQHDIPRFGEEVMHTLKITPPGAEAIASAVKRWGLAS